MNGTFWDFGMTGNSDDATFGLTDGTFDTVDGAMLLTFDDVVTVGNHSLACASDTTFSLSTFTAWNGLEVTRNFYVPKGKVSKIITLHSNLNQ
jgi:hypothetical protein